MTDRTTPFWEIDAEADDAASTAVDDAGRQPDKPDADAARRRFLRRLDHQENILDRAVKEIDGVADQLRRAAANGANENENWAKPAVSPLPERSATTTTTAPPATSNVSPTARIAPPATSTAQAVAAQPSVTRINPTSANAMPANSGQASPTQVGATQTSPAQTRPVQLTAAQASPTQASPTQASPTQASNVTHRAWPPRTEAPVKTETLSELRDRMSAEKRAEREEQKRPVQEEQKPEARAERPVIWPTAEMKDRNSPSGMVVIEGDRGPIKVDERSPGKGGGSSSSGNGGGGGGGTGGVFHKRLGPVDFTASLRAGLKAIRQNLMIVMVFTIATNVLVLAIPVYLFQISDRVLTSRSLDTLMMLTALIVGAVVLQTIFDGIRRMILMRTAVEVAAQLGAPILSAAARAALHSNGREYQTLGDLQQLRSFLVSGTLLSFLDAPIAPFFVVAVFLIHPHLGAIVITSAFLLLIITLLNQKATAAGFGEATNYQTKANLHLDSMSRNSQIINALAMIPEAVHIWGKDMAGSLKAQVLAQDRNIAFASLSKAVRLLTQVTMLGWGANLALHGHLTGGMVISASIIAGRALGPIEAAIEGWHQVIQARAAYGRISALLHTSPLNFERLKLPRPEGRLDVERLLFVPQGTKRVVLNGITFALEPGDSLAVIGSSGAGKTTLGKMLVGSILPTSGNVRLDLMDLRNWDQRQFGESIGYLPQDVQLFPGTIKANIARMREDATDAEIYAAAKLADVHDMIASLPHGYETVVAADGSPLSGGQKQRVALARAFFGNPRMVVLDEPNSNLDTSGEAALTRALTHAKREKITVITITQRPALLNSVDKVLLLVNGTVALFGQRQDVLKALASRGVNTEGNPIDQPQLP